MSDILDFLLDLILDWDEIPSYEHLAYEPEEVVEPETTTARVLESSSPSGVIEVHDSSLRHIRRFISKDISYEEYQERGEPTRGEIALERYSTYR